MPGCDRDDGTADAVKEVVLVRHRLPESVRLCRRLIVYQLGSVLTGGAFGIWTIIALILLAVLLFLLFRPDPYKNQKVYSRRSVQE